MKSAAWFLGVVGCCLLLLSGCKKQQSDADAIRAGINQHLQGLKTLNLDAMDMNVRNVSVQGNQAQAEVEFTPKGGAPGGAGMQVSYTLEKQNGAWVVQQSQPMGMGGAMQHPGPGGSPDSGAAPSGSSGSMPNFRDVVPSDGSGKPNALPAGHPPVQ